MKIEYLDLHDRLSKGIKIWPFGECDYAVVVSTSEKSASVPFFKKEDSENATNEAIRLIEIP